MDWTLRFLPSGLGASLSRAIADLSETGISEVAMTVFGDPDVVPLWFGEGDLVTPDFVRDAAAEGLQAGETFYTWQRGLPELRAALSTYTERLYGIECAADRISVTTGGMQAILLCCQLLLDPGDNIVIVSPIWPNITSATRLMRGEPKYVALDRREGAWSLDVQKVFDAVDPRTRAIFVNSPGNPTGWTMTSDQQRALLDFARKRGLWIMADEVYARLIYTRAVAPSFLELAEPDDALLVLNSFSKPWAMTGWRIGWLTHPAALGEQLAKLVQINTSGLPAFLQRGAIAALEKGDAFVEQMVERCRAGGELVFQRLSANPRVTIARPEAAFYNFFSVDGVDDTMAFCKKLARDHKVGLAPGEAFAAGGQGNIRLCFASGAERLSKGLDRIEAAIKGGGGRYDDAAMVDSPSLEVRHLRKVYGEIVAVDDLTFSTPRGAVLGLLGGNGAGKTTTIAMLLGLLEPTAGEIQVLGIDMRRRRYAALPRMNFSSPYVDLPHRLTVRQNLAFYGRLYGVKDLAGRVEEIAQHMQIAPSSSARPASCRPARRPAWRWPRR